MVFNVTAGGASTTLYSFDFTDGAYPDAGLVLAGDGNVYGKFMQRLVAKQKLRTK